MFCPKCRSEYVAGVSVCAHCEVPLTAELPSGDIFASVESMAAFLKGRELQAVSVGKYVDLREVQRLLAAERIASVIAGEAQEEVDPGLHTRLFLMVETARLDDVRAFFQARMRAGLETEGLMLKNEGEELAEGACPACGTVVPADQAECPECGLFLGNPDAAE